MNSNFPILAVFIITLPLFLLGLGFFLWGMRGRQQWMNSKNWASTTAQIIRSEVVKERKSNGRGVSTVYIPKIDYTYRVDGQPYQSSQFNFGRPVNYGTSNPAQTQTDRYTLGSAVDILYNPANPAQAVLEPTLSRVSKLMIAIGLIIGLSALGLALLALIFAISVFQPYTSI